MKPMMILAPDVMSDDNIQQLRDNGLCVVVANDPAAVRFVDPLPAVTSRTEMENAAIALSRRIFSPGYMEDGKSYAFSRGTFASMYVDLLTKGTSLDENKSLHDQQVHDNAYYDEIRRLAREEAKANRDAAKAEKAKGKK